MEMAEDANTKRLVDNVLARFQLQANWLVLNFNDASTVVNAWAMHCDDKRYIITNYKYLQEMNKVLAQQPSGYEKDETYWGLVGVVAHEVGHHLNNHVERRTRTIQERHQFELEADYYMGFTLAKLGAEYEMTMHAIRDISEKDTATHPAAAARRAHIARGWEDGSGRPAPIVAAISNSAFNVFETRHSRDIEGNDIIHIGGTPGIPGMTHEQCARRCDQEPHCKAYSFDKWRARCYLKDAIAESYLDPSSVIGAKRPGELPSLNKTAVKKVQIYRARTFRDTPVDPPTAEVSFEVCGEKCNLLKRCVVFSFVKASGKCSLFSKADGFFFDTAVDSGGIRHER